MKIVTLNQGKNSLFLIIALLISMSSCNKDAAETDIVEQPIRTVEETFFLEIPNELSEKEAIEWAESLSNDELKSLSVRVDENFSRTEWCHPWSTPKYVGKIKECNACNWSASQPNLHYYYYVKHRYCWENGQKVLVYRQFYESYCRSYC